MSKRLITCVSRRNREPPSLCWMLGLSQSLIDAPPVTAHRDRILSLMVAPLMAARRDLFLCFVKRLEAWSLPPIWQWPPQHLTALPSPSLKPSIVGPPLLLPSSYRLPQEPQWMTLAPNTSVLPVLLLVARSPFLACTGCRRSTWADCLLQLGQ